VVFESATNEEPAWSTRSGLGSRARDEILSKGRAEVLGQHRCFYLTGAKTVPGRIPRGPHLPLRGVFGEAARRIGPTVPRSAIPSWRAPALGLPGGDASGARGPAIQDQSGGGRPHLPRPGEYGLRARATGSRIDIARVCPSSRDGHDSYGGDATLPNRRSGCRSVARRPRGTRSSAASEKVVTACRGATGQVTEGHRPPSVLFNEGPAGGGRPPQRGPDLRGAPLRPSLTPPHKPCRGR